MTPAKPLTSVDDSRRQRPLVVTDAPDLLDDLLRLAAAAGSAVTVAPTARAASRYWASAPLVVVGADRAAACVAAGLPERSDIVLVGADVDDHRTWNLALLINAEHVIFLPEAETWLVNLFSRAADAARRRSRTVGVLGGRGGVGSTTLAVALARAGLRRGVRSVLLEVDPFGGIAVGDNASDADGPPGYPRPADAPTSEAPTSGAPVRGPAAAGAPVGEAPTTAAPGSRPAAGPSPAGPRAAGPSPESGSGPLTTARHGAHRGERPVPPGGWSRRHRPGPAVPGGTHGRATGGGMAGGGGSREEPFAHEEEGSFLDWLLAGPTMTGGDLPVLSWDRATIPVLPPAAVGALFATACGSADLIVADLPRSADPACDVGLFLCETVLVVVTTQPWATAAAARVVAHAARTCSDVRLVVRLPPPGSGGRGGPATTRGTDPSGRSATAGAVAARLGLPLAGVIHDEPGASPTLLAAPGRPQAAGGRGDRPTTGRTSGKPRSDATDRTTDRDADGNAATGSESRVGASIIKFSDLFIAELGLDGGARR
ncbi:septum site-determining protein Ssd [Parafrankia discariae]|uniref:septum site-determining protein Ssd n=1 Tax=Parafrankia discariae TaxID=365528 RepID=UPI0003734C82|nr:septum site-determining protein Ssd [Parafrankia discariae]